MTEGEERGRRKEVSEDDTKGLCCPLALKGRGCNSIILRNTSKRYIRTAAVPRVASPIPNWKISVVTRNTY